MTLGFKGREHRKAIPRGRHDDGLQAGRGAAAEAQRASQMRADSPVNRAGRKLPAPVLDDGRGFVIARESLPDAGAAAAGVNTFLP